MSWRYENAGTSDTLIISGTTLTDLPDTQSKTGTAFYQTTRAKCFDLPATPEVWLKFDVYFNGSNRWRAFNGGDNSNPYNAGVTAQTSNHLSLVQNSVVIQNTAGICKTNQLQTVLLHMVSGSSAGVIEAWVDGDFIYRYGGDVNHGEPFADIYLQSDGAGTFFSNVIISDAEIDLGEGYQIFDFDTERKVKNVSWYQTHFKAWLPLHVNTQDLCGNTWTVYGSPTIDDSLVLNGNRQYLKLASVELGGQDFYIDCWVNVDSSSPSYGRVLNIVNPTNGYLLATVRKNANDATKLDFWANTYADVSQDNGYTHVSTINSVGSRVHVKLLYRYSTNRGLYLYINDQLAASRTGTNIPQYNRRSFDVYIGANANGSQGLVGAIDEVRIYDGTYLASGNGTPPTKEDYIALGLDLTGESQFAFDADTARQVVNALGQAQAITFDGAGAYGIFPATVVQSLSAVTSYTFEITFSTEDTRTGSDGVNCYALISYNYDSLLARNAFTLAMENGSPWVRTTYAAVFFQPSIKLNGGQVHQLALVKDETRLSLYVDGGLIASNTGYDINFVDLSRSFYLGTTKYLNRFLQMDLYGLRIWSRALSAEELFATLDGSEQGLLADYLPELRDDNILPDISDNENHLTLYGAVAPQWSFVLDADTECIVTSSFGYEGIDAVTTSELIRVEDKSFNLTGSAFYSADLTLPSMQEVWIEFSIYNRDLDGWQVGNDHDNFTGIVGEPPDTSTTSTPLNFKAYNLNAVISSDTSGLTKTVQTFLMHMIADEVDGLIEVWIDGVPHYTYRGSVNGGKPFDKMFLHSSGATCFQSFRISNTEFPSKQIIVLDFDVEALVVNEAHAWSVDETHIERYWAPPGGTHPPNFIDVIVHDRTAWYQTVVTKAFDLPPTYHLWIDFDVCFDGVHSWRAGNIGSAGLCGIINGNPLSGFSNGEQIYPVTNLLQATGDYEWTPVLVHLQSGTSDGIVEAWFNGDKVFAYTGNVNDGEPFADPCLQSDGAGTYFSTLLFSTNPLTPRRNVEVIYLCLRRNGQVLTFPLYAYETCDALALAVYHDGRNWYNVLRDPSDERASDFYITHAESTYALTKG